MKDFTICSSFDAAPEFFGDDVFPRSLDGLNKLRMALNGSFSAIFRLLLIGELLMVCPLLRNNGGDVLLNDLPCRGVMVVVVGPLNAAA